MEERKERCRIAQLRNAVRNFSNERIIKKILATGVDVNQQFRKSSSAEWDLTTSLHLAAGQSSPRNFQILLAHGADVTIKDSEGFTALHRLVRGCFPALDDQADEAPDNPLISAVLAAHVESSNSANPRDNHGFTHFHVACLANHAGALELFLNNGVAVDEAVGGQSRLFPGYTGLHFAARFASLRAAELLLQRGAEPRARDARGTTVAQLLVQRRIAMLELLEAPAPGPKRRSAAAVQAKLRDNEAILGLLLLLGGPERDIGMPKCHAACTLREPALAARLLQGLAHVDAPIERHSPAWPGYTALHFAAHCNVNTMLLLLDRGADIQSEEAAGLTPFDICIRWCSLRDLHCIVGRVGPWRDIRFSDGQTKLLDCIAAMRSPEAFAALLRQLGSAPLVLPSDSPLWPGSTLLHLAVIFEDRPSARQQQQQQQPPHSDARFMLKACLQLGIAVDWRDLRGRTAAHLAFRLARPRLVELLLPRHPEDSSDDENLSLLHIACATGSEWLVDKWLRAAGGSKQVDVNVAYSGAARLGKLQPGWTPLHVAVACNCPRSLVRTLLEHGADPRRVDATSSRLTAVHLLLATPRLAPDLSELLLPLLLSWPARSRPSSAAALGLLHVASYFDDARAVEGLLELGCDIEEEATTSWSALPRAFAGCRPLHVAMANKCTAVVELLLRRGADVLARRGADREGSPPDRSTPLSQALTSRSRGGRGGSHVNAFVAVLRSNEALRRRVAAELGLSVLHVVCRAGHVDAVRDLLSRGGADVNARTRDDSDFWPGWTPLHVLVTMGVELVHQHKQLNDFKAMLRMLLEHGAEPTIANADGDTPLHLLLKKYPSDTGYFIMTSLLSRQRDFSVNPVNKDGLTHFHAACLANDLEAVGKFLACHAAAAAAAIDVNQPIDYLADHYAGSTPLHLALSSNSKRYFGIANQLLVLDLLLKYRADVQAEDDHGYSPLHVAADCDPSCVDLLQKLIDNGADINARTLDGKTAFEMVLSSKEVSVEEIQWFAKQAYQMNACNPMTDRGYLSIILNEKNVQLRASILKALMDAACVAASDQMGRTAVHNIVATDDFVISEHDYVQLIDKLIKLGCELNEQDHWGMTALHLALIFRNEEATAALLICGADVSIVDWRGQTAFCYALEACTRCFTRCSSAAHVGLLAVLVEHARQLKRLGLHVSELNDKMLARARQSGWIGAADWPPQPPTRSRASSGSDYDRSKDVGSIAVGPRGWRLRDFLREHGPVVQRYHTLTPAEQRLVDQFFQTIDYRTFRELRYVLKVQYRQAVARGALISPAIAAIEALLGLPNLCAELVVRYLRNPDLNNAIAAAAESDR